MTKIVAIACIEQHTRAIGREDGSLLYWIKKDLRRFKTMTTGHPIIVGRKTFETFPKGRPLPERTNIIVTRNQEYSPDDCVVCLDPLEALAEAKKRDNEVVYVVGGATIYRQLLHETDELALTVVDGRESGQDEDIVLFPEFACNFSLAESSPWELSEQESGTVSYQYQRFVRSQ